MNARTLESLEQMVMPSSYHPESELDRVTLMVKLQAYGSLFPTEVLQLLFENWENKKYERVV